MDETPTRMTQDDVDGRVETAPDRSTQRIRSEIEQTRDDMSETIEALQEKLRPRNIAADAVARVRGAASERINSVAASAEERGQNIMVQARGSAGSLAETVRHNPIPAAMVAFGAAWLLWDRARPDHEYDVEEPANRVDASVRGARTQAAETTAELSSRAREYAGTATRRVRGGGRRAQDQLQRFIRRNPLIAGAGAFALGSAVALLVPETEAENEWLGEARDHMVDRAKGAARYAASRAQEVGGQAAGQLASDVLSGQGNTRTADNESGV